MTVGYMQNLPLRIFFKKFLRVILVLVAVLLTGCLQYDLDIEFDSQTHGQLVQQLHWRSGAIAPRSASGDWLQVLTERTRAVGGKLRFIADDRLEITVPFNNGKELETRFNQFFGQPDQGLPFTLPGGEPIQAALSIQQTNRLLAIYNHISLHVDLTAVPDLADTVLPLLQETQLFTGRITLTTPWERRSPDQEGAAKRNWSLVPGKVNQIEAEFWVPSPIGIGAVAIALLVTLGYGVKYGFRKKVTL